MRLLFLLSTFLLITTLTFGQNEAYTIKDSQANFKKVLKRAQKERKNKKYKRALGLYEAAIAMDSTDTEALYEIATLYDSLSAYVAADRFYDRAAESDNKKDYPLIDFRHAKILQILGDYRTAIEHYEQFRAEHPELAREIVYRDAIIQNIEFCKKAVRLEEENVSIYSDIRNVGDPVNDMSRLTSEFAPYEENGELYFSRFKDADLMPNGSNYDLKVYKYRPSDLGVNKAVRTEDQNAYIAISMDGNHLYEVGCANVTRSSINKDCKIYRRDKTNTGQWSKRIALPAAINLEGYTNSQPSIGEDNGKTYLYFSSDRPGGKGKRDIWRSEITKSEYGNLSYAAPTNLEGINTAGHEISPYYHSRCGILYFSSNSEDLPSLGGFDIYQSTYNGAAYGWTAPKHLGHPINGSFDDVDFFRNFTGEKAFFASKRVPPVEREEGRVVKGCCLDIFEANLEMPVYLSLDVKCGSDIVRDATYTYTGMTPKGSEYMADKDSAMLIVNPIQLQANEQYQFTITKDGYTTAEFNLPTNNVCEPTTYPKAVYIRPLQNLSIKVSKLVAGGKELISLEDSVSIRIETDGESYAQLNELMEASMIKAAVAPDDTYRVLLKSPFFEYETLEIDFPSIEEACSIEREITLVPKLPINEELEVALYFHDDIPARRRNPTRDIRDSAVYNLSYETTYLDYIEMRETYKNRLMAFYQKDRDLTAANTSAIDVDNFFDNQVKTGFDTLQLFAAELSKYFERENALPLSVTVQGSASPTADSQAGISYNRFLSMRRINSVRNYLKAYDRRLNQAIKSGRLVIQDKAIGQDVGLSDAETQKIIDNYEFGVYAPLAAATRKVTITKISFQK